MSYFIIQNEETKGPYTIGQLRSMWNAGAITGDTFYCEEGYKKWLRLTFIADQLEGEFPSSIPVPSPPPIPITAVAKPQKSSGVGKVLGFGCLGVIGLFALTLIIGSISGDSGGGGNVSHEPYPTDSATQQRLANIIAGYQATGVFTKIQVYAGDQVWVYVSDGFSKLTFDDKHHAIAAIYSVYHTKNSVEFVVLRDAYTEKNVGMYQPSYGLKLN